MLCLVRRIVKRELFHEDQQLRFICNPTQAKIPRASVAVSECSRRTIIILSDPRETMRPASPGFCLNMRNGTAGSAGNVFFSWPQGGAGIAGGAGCLSR